MDVTGVTTVMADVSACFDDALAEVVRTLAAVDDALSSLRSDASGVRTVLETVFAPRRRSGPGLVAYASEVATRLQDATLAFIHGDDEMAAQTTAASRDIVPPFRRGTGSVVF